MPKEFIEKITLSPPPSAKVSTATTLPTKLGAGENRFVGWEQVVQGITSQAWATAFDQIPATVIDVGVFDRVPYQSYRFAEGDFELNVYGDPARPSGIEVGVYGDAASSPTNRERCIALVVSFLRDRTDAAIVAALDRDQDIATRGDLTFEVTPQTAPDAYGGWWISVYDTKALDKCRATQTRTRGNHSGLAGCETGQSESLPGLVQVRSDSSARRRTLTRVLERATVEEGPTTVAGLGDCVCQRIHPEGWNLRSPAYTKEVARMQKLKAR